MAVSWLGTVYIHFRDILPPDGILPRAKFILQNSFSVHLRTIAQVSRAISSQIRHLLTIGKKLLNSNMSYRCPHNMVNFGPLAAEIFSLVWGTPANFNGFRVMASLLQRRRLPEANQTLRDVWPSLGLVHYIYTFGISCLLTEFCHVQNSLCVHLCTIAQVSRAISSQLRHLSKIGKKTC